MSSPRNRTEPTVAEITDYLDATTGIPAAGADVIFVPGTRHTEPALITAELLARDVAPVAVLTGVNPHTGLPEAREHHRILVEQGIDPARLIVEDRSTNTLENAVLSLPLLQARVGDFRTVLAITKWMHSRRVLMTLKANWPAGLRFHAHTYAPWGVTPDNWADGAGAEPVRHNWTCIPRYLAAGHLTEIVRDGDGYV